MSEGWYLETEWNFDASGTNPTTFAVRSYDLPFSGRSEDISVYASWLVGDDIPAPEWWGNDVELGDGPGFWAAPAWFMIGAQVIGTQIIEGGDTITLGYGTSEDDTHTGNSDDETTVASDGSDSYDGGGGFDNVNYNRSDTSVVVDLSTGTGSGGMAEGDTYSNIEGVGGSQYADTLTGNAGDNELRGNQGGDTLTGGDGQDLLSGGAGADSIFGGAGQDMIYGGTGNDIINGGSFIDVIFAGNGADDVTGRSASMIKTRWSW